MHFLVLKETKNDQRVALNPTDAGHLVKNKHVVYIQSNAGKSCGYFDQDYLASGCQIVKNLSSKVAKEVDFIIKLSSLD